MDNNFSLIVPFELGNGGGPGLVGGCARGGAGRAGPGAPPNFGGGGRLGGGGLGGPAKVSAQFKKKIRKKFGKKFK